jgi:hypothetical protein
MIKLLSKVVGIRKNLGTKLLFVCLLLCVPQERDVFANYTGTILQVSIEHSCMGEFRDMGIPAQVVKKKSCTSGEAENIQEIYSSMSHYIKKHLFGFF